MILYDYFRSTAGYRVRIALQIKRISVVRRPIHLLRGGGEQRQPDYLQRNPQGLAPMLELDNGVTLTQSLAIIDYLETVQPDPPLHPKDPVLRAQAKAIALAVACDIHPLTNLRVIQYLEADLGLDQAAIADWRRKWISSGLQALEKMIFPKPFCYGASPTIAEVCLIPQLYNAHRFGVSLDKLPKLQALEAACADLPAFRAAHPSAQSDAE
jgi:maleylacetoacetate isomerase